MATRRFATPRHANQAAIKSLTTIIELATDLLRALTKASGRVSGSDRLADALADEIEFVRDLLVPAGTRR